MADSAMSVGARFYLRDAANIAGEGFAVVAQRDDAEHPSLPGIMAGLLVPHFICTIAVGLRAVCRYTIMRKWYIDDTLITIAWVSSTFVVVIYSIAASTDQIRNAVISVASPTVIDLEPYLLRTYLGLIFYQICLCLIKLSVLAFYLRMFADKARERRMAWATVLWVMGYGVPLLFMSIFQCHPAPGLFFGAPMQCFEFTPLLIISASLHSITDVWLVLMIVPCVRKLELPPKQKWALSAVLGMSVFVVAASMIRLQLSIHQKYKPMSVQVANTQGFFVLTILECDIAIICATAPTLRLLILKYCPVFGENGLVNRPQRWTTRYSMPAECREQNWVREDPGRNGWEEPRSAWLEPPTPYSRSSDECSPEMAMPAQPVPTLTTSHRAPTTLSLRSVLSGMVPRSRGHGGDGDAKKILNPTTQTRELANRNSVGPDTQRMSMGFEGYYDQYLDCRTPNNQRESEESSGSVMGLQTRDLGGRRWANSQESFVMGMNDPASPSRMSPVSCMSGDTYAVQHDELSADQTSKPTPGVEPRRDLDGRVRGGDDEPWDGGDDGSMRAMMRSSGRSG